MEISENFRRMCEDVVLTGIVRELANISFVNTPGLIEAYHQPNKSKICSEVKCDPKNKLTTTLGIIYQASMNMEEANDLMEKCINREKKCTNSGR
uniref:Uncharacterized protein n=1 Tax=Acrobeloides nanus TaxID=290746 RepID=A0A914CZL0_9BILA